MWNLDIWIIRLFNWLIVYIEKCIIVAYDWELAIISLVLLVLMSYSFPFVDRVQDSL